MVSASMALWLNTGVGNTGVTSSNKNKNVLKKAHLRIPKGKQFTLVFEKPIIPILARLVPKF